MPKNTVPAAGEAMPHISRRKALGLLAGATISPTIAVAATRPTELRAVETTENPALLLAYDRFTAARAELVDAKSALEWLADEWRHVWPLAPEELLGGANADRHGYDDDAERDIVGRYIKRDMSALTQRLSAKWRQKNRATCFAVMSPEEATERLEFWTRHVPKGRTHTALEQNRVTREKFIRQFQHRLVLARQYQDETARLREAAGVDQAKQRIEDARTALASVRDEISIMPAFTHDGLYIKAEAIKSDPHFEGMKAIGGLMARFVEAAMAIDRQHASGGRS
jgi:hypothetical protein